MFLWAPLPFIDIALFLTTLLFLIHSIYNFAMISAMYSKEYLLYFPTLYVCSLNSMYSSLFSVLEVLLFSFTLISNYVTICFRHLCKITPIICLSYHRWIYWEDLQKILSSIFQSNGFYYILKQSFQNDSF